MLPALQLEFLDLRHFSAEHLRPLLDEESARWSSLLRWDYRNSAALVLQYVDSHLLTGYVALDQGRVCGYVFCVYENSKAVIGDVFASRVASSEDAAITVELQLIERLLETLQHTPGLSRVEAQLLLHPQGQLREPFEQARFRVYPRFFMELDMHRVEPNTQAQEDHYPGPEGSFYRKWLSSDFDLTSPVIMGGYIGHIDSEINDQYLSASGAQRFLHNIVRFPGCGIFEPQASWVLVHPHSQELLAVLLCSRVSAMVGHVTQICVLPEFQNKGVGRTLLQLCASSLQTRNCEAITLTVTEENMHAVALYRQLGYTVKHRFDAMLWTR